MIYACLAWLTAEKGYRLFYRRGWLAFNYRGEKIVQGLGLFLLFHYLLFIIVLDAVHYGLNRSWFPFPSFVWLFLFMAFSLAAIGWVDDRWGDVTVKGFKGHLGRFFHKKEVTTGLLKACVGLFCSLVVCFPLSAGFGEYVLDALAMVLSMHTFNLLDVRPGRALKSYWLFTLILIPFFSAKGIHYLILPLLVSTLVLFRYDRLRLAMLGDTGSLTLGGSFGFQLIYDIPPILVALWVAFFFVLTFVAEKKSISGLIDNSRWLSKLDRWGIARK